MKRLLDVNVLLAAIWSQHPHHTKAFAWLKGKEIVVCPICELGFLRVSTNKKAFNIPMQDARTSLVKFKQERSAESIADDLPALDSKADKSEQLTDAYLADLADKHGLMLGTLDGGISHRAVEVIS